MGVFEKTDVTAQSRSGWVDFFRFCRALALVAMGATVHLHLVVSTPGVSTRVAPLSVASAPVEAAERGIAVDRALVFAPLFRPADSVHPVFEDIHPVEHWQVPDAKGLLAAVHTPPPSVPRTLTPAGFDAPQPSSAAAVAPLAPAPFAQAIALALLDDGLDSSHELVAEDLSALAITPIGPRHKSEEELVRQLIDRYAGALERLDVSAAQAAWPTVDGKALKRAFGQLASQRLTFQSCGITISGSTANARCRGSATYRPRIGSGPVHLASREWTFDFSKQDTDWRIVNTFVR
jgi:hypothetical protein